LSTLVAAITVLGTLAGLAGAGLTIASRRAKADGDTVVAAIDALLPQTQCAQCGFPGCRPYAEAVANGAPINRCPPGGATLVRDLADLLGRPVVALDESAVGIPAGHIAYIDETRCIGCALCLPACPVDAIVGAPQFLHTVIAAECTGCGLCLPSCPVDCIDARPPAGPGAST